MSYRVAEGWLHRPAPRVAPRMRLLCFPYAGGGAAFYRPWAAELPEDIELLAVQLPGRADRLREPALDSVPAIVDRLVRVLAPWVDSPYVLFGHSMGAIVAAEVARSLIAQGPRAPSHLVVSGRRPAHLRGTEAPLRDLPDAEFVLEIQRRYGGIPAEVLQHADLMALLLPCLRADIAALERFAPGVRPPLACPVTVLGGAHDPLTPLPHLEAWRRDTVHPCEVRTFAGDHFYLTPQREAVLSVLRDVMAPAPVQQPAGSLA